MTTNKMSLGEGLVGGSGGATPIYLHLRSADNSSQMEWPTVNSSDIWLNDTNSTWSNNTIHKRFTIYEQIFYGTWLSISMILAVFGNLMVIAVVWRHRGMRTRTNMFLVSLAVADFLVGFLLCPFSLSVIILQEWIWGKALCVVDSFLNALCLICSIQNLMYISIHKYLSITRPLTRITKNKILIMIVAAWSWGLICALLTTVILTHAEFKDGTMQCGPAYPVLEAKSIAFHFIIQISNIYLPLMIMMGAYFRMFQEIREHMQRLDENTALDRDTIYGQQRRVTITLFIVLACFTLCWLPYSVYSNYVTFKEVKDFPPYLNAIVSTFVYAMLSKLI